MTPWPPHDVAFAKYAEGGAYHWKDVGRHWLYHNAFTAERYRRTLAAVQPFAGQRVLDYGCGDGALLGWIVSALGGKGEAHGFDPNQEARKLSQTMLRGAELPATLHANLAGVPDGFFDKIVCADVIEHVLSVGDLVDDIERLLKPGGRAVITTPVRLSEVPEDPNHVREWFPREFIGLFEGCGLQMIRHEQFVPVASTEVYFWRPAIFLRIPIFRLLCNVLSIYGGVNALSWLRLRSRLFMAQLAVLEKPL